MAFGVESFVAEGTCKIQMHVHVYIQIPNTNLYTFYCNDEEIS